MLPETVATELPAQLNAWKDEEAGLRTARFFVTGRNPEPIGFTAARGPANVESELEEVRAVLYQHDRGRRLRFSHENPEIARLHDELFGRSLRPRHSARPMYER